ncbi:MAG: SAF domain-containing protein [Eubacteriales bacterium]|nr:SAF domain-containing protein [Eubacteriales bacterium]
MMDLFKNRAKRKGLIGILLIILTIAGIYTWENYGRQELTYTDVIVFKEDIGDRKIVTRDMLGLLKLERKTLPEGVITEPGKIIGKETLTFLPSKIPLSEKFFADPELTSGNGKYVFKIPEKWVYSFPQTLRRGDEIYIYLIRDTESQSAIGNESRPEPDQTYDITKPILEAKVVYVKDNANREVVNTGNNRYDGSATLAQIEIIVTQESYNLLRDSYINGYQFNLMYQ